MSGAVVWFSGLPQSGKSTLAARARSALRERGVSVAILDSDELRECLVPGHGYDDDGRDAFYATLGNLAGMLARQGLVVLVAATAHKRRYRVVPGAPRLHEVHLTAPRDTCAERDRKGLYAAAAEGEVTSLPGVGRAFEAPVQPDVTATGGRDDAALEAIIALVG